MWHPVSVISGATSRGGALSMQLFLVEAAAGPNSVFVLAFVGALELLLL